MSELRADERRLVDLAIRLEAEVYVTAPGASIDESHSLVGAAEEAHAEVFGSLLERDVTRWCSDASVLTRYGIATVNHGTSIGLPEAELGENLAIDGLQTAEVYAPSSDEGVRRRVSVNELPADLPAPWLEPRSAR